MIKLRKITHFLTLQFMLILLLMQNSNAKPKVVIFDLGEVIVQLDWKKPLSTLGIGGDEGEALLRKHFTTHDGFYDVFERGKMEEKEYFEAFKKEFSLTHDESQIRSALNEIIKKPVDGIEEILNQISKNYPLYILSNISFNIYKHLGLHSATPSYSVFNQFRKIYTSFELRCRKPEFEIYSLVYNDIKKEIPDLLSSDILFIDDRQDNVDGAIKAGWIAETSKPANIESIQAILKKHEIIH